MMSRRVASNLETKHMREVLTNFRINSSDVTVISNMKASARPELWTAFRLALSHIYIIYLPICMKYFLAAKAAL